MRQSRWSTARRRAPFGRARPDLALLNPPKPVFEVVTDGYFALFDSLFRICDYARATKTAFDHLMSKDPDEVIGADDLGKLMAAVNLRGEADFLRQESERADAMVYGQATISLWSALSCGIEDMIVALLANDDKLLALDVANKVEFRSASSTR